MSWKTSMLGSELLSKNGRIKAEDLEIREGDVLGLYVSAHWCPPCRTFTPQLVDFYNKVNGKGGKKFQVVFVSADRAQDDFNEYFKEMPWHAVPFERDEIGDALQDKFGFSGIPKLLLIDCKGQLIETTDDSRSMVVSDPEGNKFPWAK